MSKKPRKYVSAETRAIKALLNKDKSFKAIFEGMKTYGDECFIDFKAGSYTVDQTVVEFVLNIKRGIKEIWQSTGGKLTHKFVIRSKDDWEVFFIEKGRTVGTGTYKSINGSSTYSFKVGPKTKKGANNK